MTGLLWTGQADGAGRLFESAATAASAPPPPTAATTADRLVACLVAQRRRPALTLRAPTAATFRAAAAIVAALFEAAGATGTGTGTGTLAQRLARGWRTDRVDDLRAALILCADHELNASAYTARVVASTGATLANVLLAALCALEGRRHGGATREVASFLDEVQRVGVARASDRVLAERGWVPGLWRGASLYPDGDPRAHELLGRLDLPPDGPIARAAERLRELGGGPSIDFALVALQRTARLPPDSAFAIFALGRSAGWIAHALEAAAEGRLIRPRARYVGPPPR